MKEELDSDKSKSKLNSKGTIKSIIVNSLVILGPLILWNIPFTTHVIRRTATSTQAFTELLYITLANILFVLILFQFKKIKLAFKKINLSWISFFIGSTLFFWSSIFILNFQITINTYWEDAKLYSDSPFGGSISRSINYDFNGLSKGAKISKDLCVCDKFIGLKKGTGIFGMSVNLMEFRPPSTE